jgi:hypothetical protein
MVPGDLNLKLLMSMEGRVNFHLQCIGKGEIPASDVHVGDWEFPAPYVCVGKGKFQLLILYVRV